MTYRGQPLIDVLCGHEVKAVSQTALENLCADLASMTPRRYVRSTRETTGNRWRVALIGAPDPAYLREQLTL